MPEPRPSAAAMLAAGAALQPVAEQQPLPVISAAQVFGEAYSPHIAALPLPALLALLQASDLAGLPAPYIDLATACLAQRYASLPRARESACMC